MALTDQEELYNLALGHTGEYEVTEGASTSKQYKLCDRYYAAARKMVLRSHPWNEAIKRLIVVQETDGPIFGPAYKFTRPTDALKVFSISQCEVDTFNWGTEGIYILSDFAESPRIWATGNTYVAGEYVSYNSVTYLCNVSNTSATANNPEDDAITWATTSADNRVIYTRYTYDLSDITLWSEDLKNAIAMQLAIFIAPALINDSKLQRELIEQNEQLTLRKARSVDAQEGKPARYWASQWARSRFSGGYGGRGIYGGRR